MEFSKKWMVGSIALTILLIIIRLCGADIDAIILASMGEVSVSSAFYFYKAKCENKAKYAQKFIERFADEYGVEYAVQITDMVTRE